jgi:murein DD-endopeptidase MepM/ murein hydrolase activator NlpD
MNEETKKRLKAVDEITYTTMTAVRQEHTGFKTMMYFMFQPVADYLRNLGSGGGFGSGGGGFGSGGIVTQNSGVTASQLNAKLGGRLQGMGSAFIEAGRRYGIDPGFLAAIAMHETGNGTSNAVWRKNNVGGMMGKNGLMSFGSLEEGIEAMASNLKRNYIDHGLTTVEEIQRKYAPIGAANDPTGLNQHWVSGVNKYWSMFGGGGGSSSGSFFKGWQNKVTSRFGSKEAFRSKAHGGLDIDGEQGDRLDALAGGTVQFIYMDDGSELDADGKKNSRSGGTEVGIRMPDGKTYFYSHLSAVNPSLKVGSQVNAGDWIGNVGGDPGLPGSGSSTTGSHLHLGYMDANGNLMNPEDLLRGLDIGDSSIGTMKGAVQKVVSEINVNLKVSGEGAKHLNNATVSQLEALVRKIVAENERLKLQLNPTKVGYGT